MNTAKAHAAPTEDGVNSKPGKRKPPSGGRENYRRLNAQERKAIAVRWLTSAGRATTESNIRMVAKVATPYAPGSKLDRIAIRALNNGFRPTHRLVTAMLDASSIDDPEPSKEQVNELVAMVAAQRRETGSGPEWKQIRKHFGWTNGELNVVMRRLENEGIIKTEYGVKGSLDVGPRAAALHA